MVKSTGSVAKKVIIIVLKILNKNLFSFARIKNDVIGSTLTTPPNSPEPGLYRHPMDFGSAFDTNSLMGQTGVISHKRWSSFWRFEVLVGLVVSNLVTFVLGATIG